MELNWSTLEIGRKAGANIVSGLDDLRSMTGRYVYVIETPRDLAVQYDKGISNVCYIGRQGDRTRGNRLYSHGRGWMARHLILTQATKPFIIHFCHPRRSNMAEAFRDIEAFLINDFADSYGSPPLFNRRKERELGEYDIAPNTTFFRKRNKNTKCAIDGRTKVQAEVMPEE